MKILQLGKFYPIHGGVEKVMWTLMTGLNSRPGVRCDMLCAKFKVDDVSPEDSALADGHLICVRALAKLAGTMIAPRMISWLRTYAGEYDIIHIHHPDPMAALALRLSGYDGRVILHWHSDIVSQRFWMNFYAPLQSWLIKRASYIVGTTPVYIAESPWLRDAQDKVGYVPIGIKPLEYDEETATRIKSSFPGSKLILSVGRLVPYKGFSHLIDAMSYLPDSYHLVVIGQGPLRDCLEAQVADAGLSGRVTFAGFVEDDMLPSYFAACDVFVLASVMKTEAFGIVQLEAFSCGKPVVATRIPGSGVSWVNENGVSGLNVMPGDGRAIADAVVSICSDDTVHGRFSSSARQRFGELFTLDTMINNIMSIYESQFTD